MGRKAGTSTSIAIVLIILSTLGSFVTPALAAATTTTSISCTYPGANIYSCTASVSGTAGTISGETMTFSQTGGTGNVTLPFPAICALSNVGGVPSCQMTVTVTSVGSIIIQAAYGGDTNNMGSSGVATLNVRFLTTTPEPFPPPYTTVVTTTTLTSSSSVSVAPTNTSIYLVLAAVALVVIVFGTVKWRKNTAGESGRRPSLN
jgi:hypothetical protein